MNKLIELCFKDAPDGFVEFSLGGVTKQHRNWLPIDRLNPEPDERQLNITAPNSFFGPALRSNAGVMGKANVSACRCVWLDVDKGERPVPWLPASVVVWSGHGWHLYWMLDRWYSGDALPKLEKIMEALEGVYDADPCHNIDRIMRIPGTINAKDADNPVTTKMMAFNGFTYTPREVYAQCRVDERTKRRILTGNMQGFGQDRSQRDWSIITELVGQGYGLDAIRYVFSVHECGDKYRDPRSGGDKYLEHTFNRVKESLGTGRYAINVTGDKAQGGRDVGVPDTDTESPLDERDEGYFVRRGKRVEQVSTFTLDPKMLLEGDDEDSFLCDIRAAGTNFIWRDQVFPVSAFTSRHNFKRQLSKAAWVWLGKDGDVEALQVHLIRQLQHAGVPRARATSIIGRHEVDGASYYVTQGSTIAESGQIHRRGRGPIIYVDPDREVPQLSITSVKPDNVLLKDIAHTLPHINKPSVIWPIIGWFMASPMKTVLEEYGYRFPTLNVFGTRGSGKTTTILKVFQPMMGYMEERSYDANTTRFVTLTILGSTNTVPIAFSEFRVASAADFTRYILLSYDTGRDPRGRADQTTVDYALTAPFSIDGEDMVEDSACLERIVGVRMSPADIIEGSRPAIAFDKLQNMDLFGFAGPYILFTLGTDYEILINEAENDVWSAFPDALPNRIRRNLIVTWFGILSLATFMKEHGVYCYPKNGASVLSQCLNNVYSVKLGRAPTEADAFLEVVANAATRKSRAFPYVIEGGILWFQLMPAFEFYVSQRAHQRRQTLSRNAVRNMLNELIGEFMVKPRVREINGKVVMAYGVDMAAAHRAGLDVPEQVKQREYIISTED